MKKKKQSEKKWSERKNKTGGKKRREATNLNDEDFSFTGCTGTKTCTITIGRRGMATYRAAVLAVVPSPVCRAHGWAQAGNSAPVVVDSVGTWDL